MNYLLHGGTKTLHKLVSVFQGACQLHAVELSKTKAAMILIKLLDDAKERGLLEEVPEASEGCEEASDGS